MKGDRFQCAKCLKWFKKTRTDQEVQKEFNANFPDDDIKEGVTLCEECYRAYMIEHKIWN